jgi:hypothetical protein
MDRALSGPEDRGKQPAVGSDNDDGEPLRVTDDDGRVRVGPAVAVWVVASLLGLVAFAAMLAASRALGITDATVAVHDTTIVAPRPLTLAIAAFTAYLTQAYVAGFYVKTAVPAATRWLALSACGALLASAIWYWDSERLTSGLRDFGAQPVLEQSRLDTGVLLALATAAVISIAQAVALVPGGRRLGFWPFVAVTAAAVLGLGSRALHGVVPHAISVVLAASAAGVVLGAGFVGLVRQANRR